MENSMYSSTSKILLVLLIIVSLFYGLNTPLFDEDEGFYAEASREMLNKHDFVTINVNGEQRYDKPPLVFWTMACSQYLLGPASWVIRLPSVLMTMTLLCIIFLFSERRWGRGASLRTLLFFNGAIQLTIINKAAIADATLHLFIVLTLLELHRFTEKQNRKSIYRAAVFSAFGFLAKGPVALIVPAGVMLIYTIRWREWKLLLACFSIPSIILFLIIVSPWFFLCYQKVGNVVFIDFFLKHNLNRFTNEMESHGGRFWYFIPVFFLGLLPFGFLHFNSLIKVKLWLYCKSSFFFMSWFCLVFFLFSCSATKLPHYILVGYTPLILISAKRPSESIARKGIIWSGVVIIFVLLVIPFIAPVAVPFIRDNYIKDMINGSREVFNGLYFVIMGLSFLILLLCLKLQFFKERIPLASLVIILGFSTFFKYFGQLQQGPVLKISAYAIDVKDSIVMPNHYLPSFSFYSKKICTIKKPQKGEIAFGKLADFQEYTYDVLDEQYGIGLVKIK